MLLNNWYPKIIFLFLVILAMTWARPGENGGSKKQKSKIEKKPIFPGKKQYTSKSEILPKSKTRLQAPEETSLTLEEYFKEQARIASKEPNNEKEKICMAARDEMFPNFLTKLGLITKMIDDVTNFRIRLKRSRSRVHETREEKRKKKTKGLTTDDVGASVEATEAIWKMKKKGKLEDMQLSSYKKPILLYKSKSNKLSGKHRYSTRRRSDDKDKLPICYGYQYLYAVDAIDDNGVPDIEVFQEYFSDLSDDKLALQLSDITHDCSEPILANGSFSCPEISKDHKWISDVDLKWSEDELYSKLTFPKSCQEACLLDSDCNGGELCCTNSCGGHTCYRSKTGPIRSNKSQSVCQDADNILNCVYDKIKKRVCAQNSNNKKNH